MKLRLLSSLLDCSRSWSRRLQRGSPAEHDHMVGTIVVNPAQAASNPPVLAQTGRPISLPPSPLLGGAVALLLLGIGTLRARRLIRL